MPHIREWDVRDVEGIEVNSPDGSARVLIASLGAPIRNCYVRFTDVYRVEMQRQQSVMGWGPYRTEMGGWTEGLVNGARGAMYENCIAERNDTVYVRIVVKGERADIDRAAFDIIENSFAYRGLPHGFRPAQSLAAASIDASTFTTHRFRAIALAMPSNWKIGLANDTDDGGSIIASSADALATVSVAHYEANSETAQSALKHYREQVLPTIGRVLRTSPLPSFGRYRNGAGVELEMRLQAGLDGAERSMIVRSYFVRAGALIYRLETYRAFDASEDRKRVVKQIEEEIETIAVNRAPIPIPKRP